MVPWHYSLRLVDPPEAPIEDRVVHNIRPKGSFTVQEDYKFNLKITWDPPAYPYKIVTFYYVWLLEEDRFINFFVLEVSFFLFWLYLPYAHTHNLLRNYKAGLDQASSFELLEDLRLNLFWVDVKHYVELHLTEGGQVDHTLALEKRCFTSRDLNLLKSFADLIARRDFVQIAKSRGGILVARAYKWKYLQLNMQLVYQIKISICLIRGRMESLGNDDVSIVHASKWEIVRVNSNRKFPKGPIRLILRHSLYSQSIRAKLNFSFLCLILLS